MNMYEVVNPLVTHSTVRYKSRAPAEGCGRLVATNAVIFPHFDNQKNFWRCFKALHFTQESVKPAQQHSYHCGGEKKGWEGRRGEGEMGR